MTGNLCVDCQSSIIPLQLHGFHEIARAHRHLPQIAGTYTQFIFPIDFIRRTCLISRLDNYWYMEFIQSGLIKTEISHLSALAAHGVDISPSIHFFLLLFSHENEHIIFAVLWVWLTVIRHYISPTKNCPEQESGTNAASYPLNNSHFHFFASCSLTHSVPIVSPTIAILYSSSLAILVCRLLLINFLLT